MLGGSDVRCWCLCWWFQVSGGIACSHRRLDSQASVPALAPTLLSSASCSSSWLFSYSMKSIYDLFVKIRIMILASAQARYPFGIHDNTMLCNATNHFNLDQPQNWNIGRTLQFQNPYKSDLFSQADTWQGTSITSRYMVLQADT